ncbi:hypothetical protein SOVF_055360, partial [Spinacia oleracea]
KEPKPLKFVVENLRSEITDTGEA